MPAKKKNPPPKASTKLKTRTRPQTTKRGAEKPDAPPAKDQGKVPGATRPTQGRSSRGRTDGARQRLGPAAMALRDSRIVARQVQGWPWEEIAKEAGISVRGARMAAERRRKEVPLTLRMDPVVIIENVAEGYALSLGDLESIAAEAAEKGQLAVAVGAKKAANDVRGKMIDLLQATGRLPRDLEAMRHLIDLRAIGIRMLDALDGFEREMTVASKIEDGEARLEAVVGAASHVRQTFNELVGIGRPGELADPQDVPGTATELPAA